MELQSDLNGSLIPSLESSVLRSEYGFQDWVFGFGQREKSGFGQRKKISGWVYDCGFSQRE